MDSINKQQPEDNHENLDSAKAIAKIREMVESADTCFFCTVARSGESNGARPMSVLQVDELGNLWFLSASDSHKNYELSLDPNVEMYFQGGAHSDFLHLSGVASISTDKAKIKELWSPLFKTWFNEGLDDPRITAIKVTPSHGYYWDTKHGNFVSGVKMLIGAVLGRTLDDSIEGQINV